MSSYGAQSITILEGLDVVRKRPGMYIGSTSERGLHHMVWEVVDNGVDEAMAGHASRVDVTLLPDGGVEVSDDGRGIPVAMHATGIPTVDVVMTQLHAGGKFDGDSYQVSGGLHGVGVSVVNALSTRLEVCINRDGYEWFQHYDRSEPGTLQKGAPSTRTGTTVRFWSDPDIFETTDYNAETIARRLQEMAFLNKGLVLSLTDRRVPDPESRVFHHPGGLIDYVRHINRVKEPIQPSIIAFDGAGDGHEVEVAMQWNAGYSESVHTFANTI
ncbi:ATP-binding protein, partial [Mycolicibacterium mucogenicum]